MSLRLLADDLTGALDTGAEFAAVAAPLHVFWHGGLPDVLPANAAVDSGTREQDEATARDVVARLALMLGAGVIAYKKVDSLMRGSTVAELASCFATGPWRAAVFAPAFPYQGRVTRDGRQWARDGDAWRPVGPPLVEALRAEGIAAHPGRIGAELPHGISVFDAETDFDLAAIAEYPAEDVLWAGTGGLAGALARSDARASPELPKPILGLFGSDQLTTATQLAACAPHWFAIEAECDFDPIAASLERGVALLSVDLPTGLSRNTAARQIGVALRTAARRLPRPGTLLVAGGETLRALCVALGATSLQLEGRILPGLPRSILRGGPWDGVTVVSKSGAFGPPRLLCELLEHNGIACERTD